MKMIKLIVIAFTLFFIVYFALDRMMNYEVVFMNSEGEVIHSKKNFLTHKENVVIKDSTGVILEEFSRKRGMIEGKFTTYFNTGGIRAIAIFLDDAMEGQYLEYFESGSLHIDCIMSNGTRHGKCNIYNQKEQLVFTNTYYRGNIVLQHSFSESGTSIQIQPQVEIIEDTIQVGDLLSAKVCLNENLVNEYFDGSVFLYYGVTNFDSLGNYYPYPKDSILIRENCTNIKILAESEGMYFYYCFIDGNFQEKYKDIISSLLIKKKLLFISDT